MRYLSKMVGFLHHQCYVFMLKLVRVNQNQVRAPDKRDNAEEQGSAPTWWHQCSPDSVPLSWSRGERTTGCHTDTPNQWPPGLLHTITCQAATIQRIDAPGALPGTGRPGCSPRWMEPRGDSDSFGPRPGKSRASGPHRLVPWRAAWSPGPHRCSQPPLRAENLCRAEKGGADWPTSTWRRECGQIRRWHLGLRPEGIPYLPGRIEGRPELPCFPAGPYTWATPPACPPVVTPRSEWGAERGCASRGGATGWVGDRSISAPAPADESSRTRGGRDPAWGGGGQPGPTSVDPPTEVQIRPLLSLRRTGALCQGLPCSEPLAPDSVTAGKQPQSEAVRGPSPRSLSPLHQNCPIVGCCGLARGLYLDCVVGGQPCSALVNTVSTICCQEQPVLFRRTRPQPIPNCLLSRVKGQ